MHAVPGSFFSRAFERILNTCWVPSLHLCSVLWSLSIQYGEDSSSYNTCLCWWQTQVWAWVPRSGWLYCTQVQLSQDFGHVRRICPGTSVRSVSSGHLSFPFSSSAVLRTCNIFLHPTLHRSMYSVCSSSLCMLFICYFLLFTPDLEKAIQSFFRQWHP